MAKMFYTLEETKGALGLNEEEIKQLSREGRLREFRDGPRLMFKADQVDNLKSELAGGDVISLGPSDSGAPIGLADSKSSPLSGSGPRWEHLWPVDNYVTKPQAALTIAWTNWPLFTVGLVQRGHSDETIRKILGENTLRVARANWSTTPQNAPMAADR